MSGNVTYKTMASHEEEVSIFMGQSGQSVERITVHWHVDGNRETRALIEADPMNVVVIGHGVLNYSISFKQTPSFIPSKQCHLRWSQTKEGTDGVRRTYMGLAKTIGGNLERPGINSNSTMTTWVLHIPISRDICTNQTQELTKMGVDRTSLGQTRIGQVIQYGTRTPDRWRYIHKWNHVPLPFPFNCSYLHTYILTRLHMELQEFLRAPPFPFYTNWPHNYTQPWGTPLISYSLGSL
jgi:hypothetical protein